MNGIGYKIARTDSLITNKDFTVTKTKTGRAYNSALWTVEVRSGDKFAHVYGDKTDNQHRILYFTREELYMLAEDILAIANDKEMWK